MGLKPTGSPDDRGAGANASRPLVVAATVGLDDELGVTTRQTLGQLLVNVGDDDKVSSPSF